MRRRWDNKEINLLKNNYKKSWEILLKLLPGRTKPALYGELYGLNLHRGYDHLKENNPRFGKKASKETRIKQSVAIKKSKIKHHKYGKSKEIFINDLSRSDHSVIHFNLYEFIGDKYPEIIDEYFEWLFNRGKISNALYQKVKKN